MSDLANLKAPSKRVRNFDAQMVTKVPSSAKVLVKAIADDAGKTEGAIVRDALAEYFERRGYTV